MQATTVTLTYPDGRTKSMPTQPSADQLADAAKALDPSTDPNALAAAIAAHNELPASTKTTILHGSRARGNHRTSETNPSDVDLLIIADHDCQEWRSELHAQAAAEATMTELGVTTSVETIWHDSSEMEYLLQFRNTLPTEAILYGVAVGDAPLKWKSPYTGPDPQWPRYHWAIYEHYLEESKISADFAKSLLINDDSGFRNEIGRAIANAAASQPDEASRRDFVTAQVHTNAHYGIRAAFRCAIAAHGDLPGKRMDTVQLSKQLDEIAPGNVPDLKMKPQQHEESTPQLGEDITIFGFPALADIETVRALAKRTRRRTNAVHPGSTSKDMPRP